MSSIITAILRSTVGLLCDKARDSGADKLKDGDLTDETMRKMIVKDLTDIKTKLDSLSLKDLEASVSFLKEGVTFLNLALDQSNEDEKADEATGVINDTASGGLNAALSLPQVIQGLKISSDERFVSAQDCFRKCHERATYAFKLNYKSLSIIKDRIMACKLRVAAKILELGLEDPEAAITACLVSLEELHGLPAIQEMFSVFLRGGLRAKINKSERLENMMSVLLINHALYDFATKYSSKSLFVIFVWPRIKSKARPFHPILNAHEVFKKTSISGEVFQQPKQVDIGSSGRYVNFFAVNSRGDIILLHDDKITVIYSTGENKDVMLPNTTEENVRGRAGLSVAVDSDDNVYAVRGCGVSDENDDYRYDIVLYVFDDNYNIKNVCVLDFPHENWHRYVNIAVDKNQNLIMLNFMNNQVYVCDKTGKLKFQFQTECAQWAFSLSISNDNNIMMGSKAIHTYSTDGDLINSPISVQQESDRNHTIYQMAFHHGICKIIVLTYDEETHSLFLLSYSETGELENSVFFSCDDDPRRCLEREILKSHPHGPLAVRWGNVITFI